VNKLLERLQPSGYDASCSDISCRLSRLYELRSRSGRRSRTLPRKTQEQAERDPDGLDEARDVRGVDVTDPAIRRGGRRFAERYTSAEAFERFARALPLAEMVSDDEDDAGGAPLQGGVKLDGKFAMAWRQQETCYFATNNMPRRLKPSSFQRR
jgi:hypothetical protein